MRKLFIFLSMLLIGCCPCRHLATNSADSLRVEVRERVEWKMLPIDVPTPPEQQEQTTPADSSYLETSIAVSWAIIQSDGSLYHSLSHKPGSFRISLNVPTYRKDSIVYRNLYREVIKEVAKPLTWWQKTQIIGFWTMITLFVAILLWRKLKNKIKIL